MKPKYRFFADRLTKQVLAIALIIMLFTMMMTFIAAYRAIRGEIKGRYLNMMNVVSGKVHMEVKDIEIEAMNVLMSPTPPKEGDLLKNKLTQIYEEHKERADKLRDDKLQEIDDAYARYTLKQKEIKEEENNIDYNKGFRMY